MVEGTAIAAVGLVLANLQVTLSVPLTARLRLTWLAVLDFAAPATTALVLIALVVARAPFLVFFGAADASFAVTLAITVALVRSDLTLRPAFRLARWRALLGESFVFAAATAISEIAVAAAKTNRFAQQRSPACESERGTQREVALRTSATVIANVTANDASAAPKKTRNGARATTRARSGRARSLPAPRNRAPRPR